MISQYISSKQCFTRYKAFLAAITTDVEPSRFSEATFHSHWQEAMQNKIDVSGKKKKPSLEPNPFTPKEEGFWLQMGPQI